MPPSEANKETPPSEGSGVVSYRLAKRSNKKVTIQLRDSIVYETSFEVRELETKQTKT
ncbi:MAG: hypothetical protein LBC74_03045 [Planctomycetaceae bacterium]|nr:hypothetical protein [Planctomycetaceae bacterium]